MSYIKKILAPIQKSMRQSVSSFIHLETADNATTLVSSDGSLISYLRVEGSKQIIGEDEYNNIVEGATIKMGARFDRQGHAMQVYYVRDPGRIAKVLKGLVRPLEISANNIGLEIDDLINERVTHLQRFLSHEEAYFVLWTRSSVLTKSEIDRAGKDTQENAKKWVTAPDSQFPYATLEPLRTRHKSYITAMTGALEELGVSCELMEVHGALNAIRANIFS